MFLWLGDWTYIILLPGLLVTIIAQLAVRSAYSKYSSVPAMCGLTGAQMAGRLLSLGGNSQTGITQTGGVLSDHYDPRKNVIRLSPGVYGGGSIAALSIAAHEAGHAMQAASGYLPFRIRNLLVPVANFSSTLAFPLFFVGLLFTRLSILCDIGILLFAVALLVQIINLPVELNASRRAMQALKCEGVLSVNEAAGAKKMLTAAAFTYIASILVSLLQILRLFALAGRRR